MTDFALHLALSAAVLGLIAVAVDIVAGHLGRLGFLAPLGAGVAAYVFVACVQAFQFGAGVSTLLAVFCSTVLCACLSYLFRSLDQEAYLLVTFALFMGASALVSNLPAIGGARGFGDGLSLVGTNLNRTELAGFILFPLVALTLFVVDPVLRQRNRIGRAMHAFRDDEASAVSLGLPVARLAVVAGLMHGAIAGTAGVAQAFRTGFVSPQLFSLDWAMLAVTAVYLGGTGARLVWHFISAALLVSLVDRVAALPISPEFVGPLQQLVFYLILLSLLLARRRGLAGPKIWIEPRGGSTR